MARYFKNIFHSSRGLIKGLGITLRYMFTPAVTVQYPYEKLPPSERFRGALAFHPETCISCEMCARACPSACITLSAARNEETKKKDLAWYRINFGRCNFCRLCEEACPTKPKAVHHTREYELTFDGRDEFVMEWTPNVPQPKGSGPGQVWGKFLAQGQKSGQNLTGPTCDTPSRTVA